MFKVIINVYIYNKNDNDYQLVLIYIIKGGKIYEF